MSAAPTTDEMSAEDEEIARASRAKSAELWAASTPRRQPAEPVPDDDFREREPIPSNDDALDKITGEIGGYDFAARIEVLRLRHLEHTKTCAAEYCPQCSRHACATCRAARVPDYDQSCPDCRVRAAMVAANVPKRHLGSLAKLATYVRSGVARERGMKAINAPNVALLGLAGRGKTSLKVGMFEGRCRFAIEACPNQPRLDVYDQAEWHAHRRLQLALQGLFVSAIDLGRARSEHKLGDGEAELVTDAMETSLLMLDDLGSEPARDSEAIAAVVHHRHANDAPMWITTGFSIEEIGARYGAGIERRLFENAVIIDCGATK